jgi:hypothetical protein
MVDFGGFAPSDVSDPKELSDEEFMRLSEKQGLVYSLRGFQEEFNEGSIHVEYHMRIIKR